jgi:DNA-binding CsgD family transcriptional regulator
MQLASANLIDRVYEAALLPDQWPSALDAVADLVSGFGAVLLVTDTKKISRWVSSDTMNPIVVDWINGNWPAKTQRTSRMVSKQHAGWINDLDVYTQEELDVQEDQLNFLRPRGLGRGAGTFIPLPSGETAVFSLERRFELGAYTSEEMARLDSARPHLARAALLAARMQLERARSAVAALGMLGLPAAVVRASGQVVASNPLLDTVSSHVSPTAFGGLALTNQKSNALLLATLGSLETSKGAGSIALPARDATSAAVLHVVPVRGLARDIFGSSSAILIITPIDATAPPSVGLLQALFDLTPAEARVAARLSAGDTIQTLAEALEVSPQTIRAQLRSIFAKTGIGRQADLINLLARTTIIRSEN